MLKIPFYKNQGYRCAQTSMRSVLKAIYHEKEFSLEELDKITGRSEKQVTWPCQIAYGLSQLGIDFKYFVKPGFKNLNLEKIKVGLKAEYPRELSERTNFASLEESILLLIEKKQFFETPDRPKIEDLQITLANQNTPLLLVNWNIISRETDNKKGHYLTIVNVDDFNVYAHDSGPFKATPKRKFCKEEINAAWSLNFFDWGLITVNSKEH